MTVNNLGNQLRFLAKRGVTEAVLFFLVAIIHLLSLMNFPSPFVDEAWFACRAWSFITTGKAFGSLDAGVFDRFPGYETFFPWLPVQFQAWGLRLFPQPELLAVRLVSLFFGLVLVAVIYMIGVRFGGRRLGLISAFVISLTMPFVYSAHLARYDIIVSAFGFSAIALVLHQEKPKKFWLSFLAGLLALFAFEIHANGAIYTPVILVLFLSEMGWATLKSKGFWGFIAGALLGGVFYIALHILRFPDTYKSIYQLAFSATHIPPILTFNPAIILKGITNSWLLFTPDITLLPLIAIGMVDLFISILKKRLKDDFLLFILMVSLVVSYGVWIRHPNVYYEIIATPMVTMVSCRFLMNTWNTWRGRFMDYFNRVLWGLVLISIGFILTRVLFISREEYQPILERISQSVHDSEVVMGSQTYWFGLYEHKYYSWETIIYYERLVPGSNFADAMRELHPDIFILDRHMLFFFADSKNNEDTYRQNLHVPIQEVNQFLDTQSQLINTIKTETYGTIEIYRINWESDGKLETSP